MKRYMWMAAFSLIIVLLFPLPVCAANGYTINGTEITYDSVEWPGDKGCWTYANDMYNLIWGVRFDNTFAGTDNVDSNMLQALSDEERLFTPEHAEIFIKSAVPGAVIRLTNAERDDVTFESDGLQKDGTYGHNIIIAAIYDDGFIAFESLSSGERERFYTWEEFYNTWCDVSYSAGSKYAYFKYIKWPSAPILQLNVDKASTAWGWSGFLLLLLCGGLLFCLGAVSIWLYARKRKEPVAWKKGRPLVLFIFIVPFFAGLFFTWGSALAVFSLCIYLVYLLYTRKKLRLQLDERFLIALLIPIAYGISCLWAVDRGLAPFGFVKFLVLPLFVLALQQFPEDIRKKLLELLPWSGAVMTVLSFGLQWIPSFYNWFTVDDRLAGFFQYPNTYALYLIVGLIELSYMGKQRYKAIKPVLAIVLLAGLLASGSRTAFLLAVMLGILRGLVASSKKQRIIIVTGVGILTIGALGIAAVFPDLAIGRYLMISTQSSTLLGRFLYYQDALPIILKHPFGLGYMGYYYSQGGFQTGVYSVMYVHNDLLQLLLDIGWLPTVLIVIFLLRQLFGKHGSWEKRLLLLAILAHSMLDFNLQFAAIWLLLLLAVDGGRCFKEWEVSSKAAAQALGAVMAAISLSFGAASFSETYLSASSTLSIYPNDTTALMTRLTEVTSTEDMENLADRILRLDNSVSIAHSAKASVAYSEGDIEEMIQQKQLAIACARYAQAEYQDYFEKLRAVIEAYRAQGAEDSAAYCISLIQEIPTQMQAVLDGTNPLAWRITDTPELALTAEQTAYLSGLN